MACEQFPTLKTGIVPGSDQAQIMKAKGERCHRIDKGVNTDFLADRCIEKFAQTIKSNALMDK